MAKTLYLSTDAAADKLLTEDPLALVIGMCLDQQIPLERAFKGPYDLAERLKRPLDAGRIASMDPARLAEIFSQKPALHRFPGSMAARVQSLCQYLLDHYDGDAAQIWEGAKDGEELRKRIGKLPGFGEMKARIFMALLGKQMGVRPKGWVEACAPFGEKGTTMSIADITSAKTLQAVRDWKGEMKAAAKKSQAKTAKKTVAKKVPAKK